MTEEKAIEIIDIVITNHEKNLETKEKLFSMVKNGVTNYELWLFLRLAGVDLRNEEVFNALFLDSFKEFVASRNVTDGIKT